MNALRINIVLLFLIIIPFFYNIYPQSNIQIDTSFSYYKFLPYYDRFYQDSNEAKIFKKNKVKSVSEFRKEFRFGKYDKEIFYEKREYNSDGFLVKITNPDIRIYRGPIHSDGHEDNRIDSTTYLYDNVNRTITYHSWIRKYPETTIYKFDSLGRLFYIEDIRDSVVLSNEIINYDLEQNRIITIDTNQYYKVNGKIFIISKNRISNILDYDDKDTVTSETFEYENNKLTIKKFENDYEDRITTRYYNTNGKLIKEIREIDDRDVVVEEYFYKKDYIKNVSYKREIESSFSLFKKVSKTTLYLSNSNLPMLEVTKWWGIFDYEIQFHYEYYE